MAKNKNWQKQLETLGLQGLVKNIPMVFLVMLFFILNIYVGHYAEGAIKDLNRKTAQLKQLRWHYINEKSELMFMTKESELAKRAVNQGLDVLNLPPSKIEINKPLSN